MVEKVCVRITNCFRSAWLGVGMWLPVEDQQVEQRTWVVWLVSSADCISVRTSKNLIDKGVSRSLAGLGWQSSNGCPGKAHMVGSEGMGCLWGG